MESHSLYELNEFIRRVMHLNFADTLWIRAEIAQIKESRGLHYLTLIEKATDSEKIIAQANAMIWGRTYTNLRKKLKKTLTHLLQDGVEVLVQVKVEFDERYGFTLMIEDIDPSYTIGKLELKRQQILADLSKANLLNRNNQLSLPPVVQRIAVLSSNSAAGLQDYLDQLKHNPYGYAFQNVLFPIAVQGVRVEKELLGQLKKIALKKAEFDAVVIIRGGGSKIDLGAFDSFELGKAIATFPLPIIVGIGHEVDETIVDQVAHTSLKTPTAVADFLIRKALHFESWIVEQKNYLQRVATNHIQTAKLQLDQAKNILRLSGYGQLKNQQLVLTQLQKQLPIVSQYHLKYEQTRLQQLAKICQLLHPQNLLEKGYSQTYTGGKIVSSTQQVEKGMELETRVADGVIRSTVMA